MANSMEGMNEVPAGMNELTGFMRQAGASDLAAICETAGKIGMSMEEVATVTGSIIFYAISWADGKIQDEEKAVLEQILQGVCIGLSENGRSLMEALHHNMLEGSLDAQSIIVAIESLRGIQKLDKETKDFVITHLMIGLFGIAKSAGSIFFKVSAEEEKMIRYVCTVLDVNYDEMKNLVWKMI